MSNAFIHYWQRLTVRTPLLQNPANKMTITVAEFEKRMRLAYEQGYRDGGEDSTGNAFTSIFPWLK